MTQHVSPATHERDDTFDIVAAPSGDPNFVSGRHSSDLLEGLPHSYQLPAYRMCVNAVLSSVTCIKNILDVNNFY